MAEFIEREKAFNALLKLIPKVDDDGYCWVIRGDAATAIDSIPAADMRPVVRGKWVTREDVAPFKPDGEITSWSYKCSECGSLSRLKYNYCPSCGADMREEN